MNKKLRFYMLFVLTAWIGCGSSNPSNPGSSKLNQAVPVLAAYVTRQPIDLEIRAVGTVDPIQKVSIRAQVAGTLSKITFQEGDNVQEGQLLFEIDPRSFEADLKKARAALDKNRAQLANAEQQEVRYKGLIEKDFITQSQYDEAVTSVRVLRAAVQADEQAVENARLQLERAFIRTPIDGRSGTFNYHLGDLIKANDSVLVQINQIQPILVNFAVPAEHLPLLRKYHTIRPLDVIAVPTGDESVKMQGKLVFIDNAVNPSSGTILLKAEFPNTDETLWPGQFVDTTVVLTTETDAIVVTSQAIQNSQQGTFVYVIRDDKTVERRDIGIKRTFNGQAVIETGLTPGEMIVVDGHSRLIDGGLVDVKNESDLQGNTESRESLS